jgi:hypothetical protein
MHKICVGLNFVPFKEVHILASMMTTATLESQTQIFKMFGNIVIASPKWKRKLNELGFVTILVEILHNICTAVESSNEILFNPLVELLCELLTYQENAALVRAQFGNSLTGMLQQSSRRAGICNLLKVLITNQNHFEERVYFSDLIQMISVPEIDSPFRILLMRTVGDCVSFSHELKDIFRVAKGFEALQFTLVLLQESPTAATKAVTLLAEWTKTCITAIEGHPENRVCFLKTIGFVNVEKEMRQFAGDKDLHGVICGMLISFAVEDSAFINLDQIATQTPELLVKLLQRPHKVHNVQFIFHLFTFLTSTSNPRLLELVLYTVCKLAETKFNQIALYSGNLLAELLEWIDNFSTAVDIYSSVDPKSPLSSNGELDQSKSMAWFVKLVKLMIEVGVSSKELRLVLSKMSTTEETKENIRTFLLYGMLT